MAFNLGNLSRKVLPHISENWAAYAFLPPATVATLLDSDRQAKLAEAKSLDDVSDQTMGQRDESFITPAAMDAPPRNIADNEVPQQTNATDKQAPAEETLKAAVKDATPSSSPQGGSGNQGNLRDQEKRNNLAETVAADTAPVAAPVQTAVVAEPAAPVQTAAVAEPAAPVQTAAVAEPAAPVAADHAESAVDKLNTDLTRILTLKPKIDAVSELINELASICGEKPIEKTAEIDVLTGAPGAGKTTAARKYGKGYDVVLHGDLPVRLTTEKRRALVVARIREAMRSHNMGKRVLVDSAPRQLKRNYGQLLNAANRVILLDTPADVSAAGFSKRTKSSIEKSQRVVGSAAPSIQELRSDPRTVVADRDTVAAMLKVAADPKPFRRRVEVIVTDGLYVYGVEKPFGQGGIWFPGGGVEGPEEKFGDAAAREVKEETGIIVDEIHRLASIEPIECKWSDKTIASSVKWEKKSRNWRGDRTYFYVATVKSQGKATDADDQLGGDWIPISKAMTRLLASTSYDNDGWKALTKARYRAVLELAPKLRAAPRAA